MIYQSSKGPVEIATMERRHAANALAKLQREEPGRVDEIEALSSHVAALDANPRAEIGGNNPPVDPPTAVGAMSWDAIKVHMDDLLTEAANWADGAELVNQEQADTVTRLRNELQGAAKLADDARVAEKAPFDLEIDAIQKRYNEYIAPIKNRTPGRISKSVVALGALMSKWLAKLEREREADRQRAREEADRAREEAIEARRAAQSSGDVSALDVAGDLLDDADAKEAAARRVEREKVQLGGQGSGVRAVSLKSYWSARLIEPGEDGSPGGGGAALRHYAQTRPERIKAFLQDLADEDVARGIRTIPGFTITEERRI